MEAYDAEGVVIPSILTTGLAPHDQIFELALVRVEEGAITKEETWLLNPGCKIPQEICSQFKVKEVEVSEAPRLAELAPVIIDWVGSGTVLAARRNDLLKLFLPFLSDHRWLCVDRLVKLCFGEIPLYLNQSMRHIRQDTKQDATRADKGARADALATAGLFIELQRRCEELYGFRNVGRMADLAVKPLMLDTINFGKQYFGRPVSEAPVAYCKWALENIKLGPDMRYTLEMRVIAG